MKLTATDLHLEDRMTTLVLDVSNGTDIAKVRFSGYKMFEKGKFRTCFVDKVERTLVEEYYPGRAKDLKSLKHEIRSLSTCAKAIVDNPLVVYDKVEDISNALSVIRKIDRSIIEVYSFSNSIRSVLWSFAGKDESEEEEETNL